jgi:flagellar biosynthesis protein FliR
MAASIFATVVLCDAARIPDHARLAAITVVVIMVITSIDPTLNPIQNAALRFSESCIGTAMAVFAVLLWPGPKESPKTALQGTPDGAARS